MKGYRGRLEILQDILSACNEPEPLGISKILQRANVSGFRINNYLRQLLKTRALKRVKLKRGYGYQTMANGEEAIAYIDRALYLLTPRDRLDEYQTILGRALFPIAKNQLRKGANMFPELFNLRFEQLVQYGLLTDCFDSNYEIADGKLIEKRNRDYVTSSGGLVFLTSYRELKDTIEGRKQLRKLLVSNDEMPFALAKIKT